MYRHLFIVALAAATGQQRWKVDTLPWAPQLNNVPNSKGRAPLVTAASVLYVPFVGPGHPNQGVEVFAPTGRPLQRLLPHVPPDAMVVAPDGICYELGGDTLTALAPAGAVRWQRTSYADTLLIGQHGTVYAAGGDRLVAYSPGGRLLWSREMADQIDTLGERADGTVLAAGSAGLSAVSPTNHLLWHRTLGRPVNTAYASAPAIAIDAAGRAYVGSTDGMVRAVAPNGSVLWKRRVGGATSFGETPAVALGPRGILVVVGTDGRLRTYQ